MTEMLGARCNFDGIAWEIIEVINRIDGTYLKIKSERGEKIVGLSEVILYDGA